MAVKMRADSGQGSQRRAETLLSKKKGTRLEGRKENSRENTISRVQEKASTPLSKRKEWNRGEWRALTMRESRKMVKGV